MDLTDAELAATVAEEAGELLVSLREQLVGAGYFSPYVLGDAGDQRANALILDRLRQARPRDAVLSEEAVDDGARLGADRVWIVDPLDGTHEYSVPGRSDWAVHIALWQRDEGGRRTSAAGGGHLTSAAGGGRLTDAAVALPVRNEVYRTDTVVAPPAREPGPLRITASAGRPPPVLWRLREMLDVELVRIGSAGAKAMAVVRGEVDAYVHSGGQWEWDSAAPAGVLWAAGLHASRLNGSPLIYNRRDPYLPDLLMCRPEVADTLLEVIRVARE